MLSAKRKKTNNSQASKPAIRPANKHISPGTKKQLLRISKTENEPTTPVKTCLAKDIEGIRQALFQQNIQTSVALNNWMKENERRNCETSIYKIKNVQRRGERQQKTEVDCEAFSKTGAWTNAFEKTQESQNMKSSSRFFTHKKNKSLHDLIESQKEMLRKLANQANKIL